MSERDSVRICVVAGSSETSVVRCAEAIAQRLSVPLAAGHDLPTEREQFVLHVCDDRLELFVPGRAIRRGITIDIPAWVEQFRRSGLSAQQPLGRAIGAARSFVVDATAGLGRDAVMAAMLGHDVLAIERSPVLAIMLEEAISIGGDHEIVRRALDERLHAREGDARDVLPTLNPRPDVVVIDPMFPPKRRASALPPKEVQALRQLVGSDPDAGELFGVAGQVAKRRVVVKRSDDAPPITADREPTMSYRGKLIRYDVYVNRED